MDSSSTDNSSPAIQPRKRKYSRPDPSLVKDEPAKKKAKIREKKIDITEKIDYRKDS